MGMSVLVSSIPLPSQFLGPGSDIRVVRQYRTKTATRLQHTQFNLHSSGQLLGHLKDGMTKAEMIKEEAAIGNNLLFMWEMQCILLKTCS